MSNFNIVQPFITIKYGGALMCNIFLNMSFINVESKISIQGWNPSQFINESYGGETSSWPMSCDAGLRVTFLSSTLYMNIIFPCKCIHVPIGNEEQTSRNLEVLRLIHRETVQNAYHLLCIEIPFVINCGNTTIHKGTESFLSKIFYTNMFMNSSQIFHK